MKKIVFIAVIFCVLFSPISYGQDREMLDTTSFATELRQLRDSIDKVRTIKLSDVQISEDWFDSTSMINQAYVLNNSYLSILLANDFTDLNTGAVQEISFDTVMSVELPYGEGIMENEFVRNRFTAAKYLFDTIVIGNEMYTNAYLVHLKQLWKGKLSYLDTSYTRVNYYAVLNDDGSVVNSLKYIEADYRYDAPSDKIYGIGSNYKIHEATLHPPFRMIPSEKDQVTVFPNPCSEQVKISLLPKTDAGYQITLVDLCGRMVKFLKTDIFPKDVRQVVELNVKGINPGNYFLQISGHNEKLITEISVNSK